MRAHPASPLVKVWLALAAIVWFLLTDVLPNPDQYKDLLRFDLSALARIPAFAWPLLLLPLVALGFGYWSWWTTKWFVEPTELRVENSGSFTESKRIAYSRIQGVEVTQPFAARLLGLAKLTVEVGANEGAELSYLKRAKAVDLREHLLSASRRERAASSAAEAAPAQTDVFTDTGRDDVILTRLTPLDLLWSAVLSFQLYGLMAFLLLPPIVGWALDRWLGGSQGGLALGGLIPLLLVVGGFFFNRIVNNWNHTVALAPGGLRITKGLTNLSSRTVPSHRVMSVTVHQPWLWRRIGRYEVKCSLLRKLGGDDEGDMFGSLVLPIGTRAQVRKVLGGLWPGVDVDALLALGDDAFTHAPERARWLMPLSRQWAGWRADAGLLIVRSGGLNRSQTVVPHRRILSAKLSAGPLQRRWQLADLTVHVAQPMGGAVVENMDAGAARLLLDNEMDRMRAARAAALAASVEVGLDVVDEAAQQPGPDQLELLGVAGGEEPATRVASLGVDETACRQRPEGLPGALVGGGHEGDVVAEHVGDEAGEQRVVGAAENEGVDVRGPQ